MKLAVFTTQLGAASETFIRRHIEHLVPGKTVAVARHSWHASGRHWIPPCPIFFIDKWTQRMTTRFATRLGISKTRMIEAGVTRWLKRHSVTAVLGEYLDTFAPFVPLLDRLGIPYVVQGHGIDLSASLKKPETLRLYQKYSSARAVLTRCEFHRQRLVQLGIAKEIIHVNPGGVDVPDRPPERSSHARKRFLAIGRMVPKKGPIFLLESFRQAMAQDPNIELDYIGGGELLSAASQFVSACRLGTRVRIHGVAEESTKSKFFGECGGFLQHSLTDPDTGDEEGLPASIQEAMAHAMTIVTTRHSGIPEAVQDGISGFLSDETDCQGMAANILKAARMTDQLSSLGRSAWQKASSEYSWASERERLLFYLRF